MSKPFDELRERLLRAGVAPRRVRRYLAELNDHIDELRRKGKNDAEAFARLGSVDDLAAPMLERPEFRSWLARAPWAAMVLGPILSMIVADILVACAVVPLALVYRWIAPWPGKVEPMPLQMMVQAVTAFAVVMVPLVIGWGVGWAAVQQRLRPWWPLIGLALFAVISGTFEIEVTFPKTLADHGELSFGFSWAPPQDMPLNFNPLRWIANVVLLLGPYVAWTMRTNRSDDHQLANLQPSL